MAARLLLVGLIVALATGSHGSPSSRLLGGEEAPTNAYPHVASVRLDMIHTCGGNLISEQHILTAAHCVFEKTTSRAVNPQRLSVRIGSSNQFAGGSLERISEITLHPDYDNYKNDLAILTLDRKLTLTDRIQVIEYAAATTDVPPVGADIDTAGWGQQENGASPYKLQHTNLIVADEDICKEAFQDYDDSFLCLGHDAKHGTCHGDAGNGAIFEKKLVGISNFIVGACGSRYPDFYSNVVHFADWIDSVVKPDIEE